MSEPYRDVLWEGVQAWFEIDDVSLVYAVIEVRSAAVEGYVAHAHGPVGVAGRMAPGEFDGKARRMFERLIREIDPMLHA